MSSLPLAGRELRLESARLVATLTRRVGAAELAAVEDAVQFALMRAVERWPADGPPADPSAWLYRVAHNQLVDAARTHARRRGLTERQTAEQPPPPTVDPRFADEVEDDLLRMLFVACDPEIPPTSQLVLALKVLCGFGVEAISARLFIGEAAVRKRLERARRQLRARPLTLDGPTSGEVEARRPAVLAVLYLLFTEGYFSVGCPLEGDGRSGPHPSLRRELLEEALRLTTALAEHPVGRSPETFALLALMHLHAARSAGRLDATGGLLLLEEQDRSLWDLRQIQEGLTWLARSATGEVFSRFHAEAQIAAEHCLAPSFGETSWDRVVEAYRWLERTQPSPLHRLNRAVATAEWQGPEAGLAVLEGFVAPPWLIDAYPWAAVLADLHRRAGHSGLADRYRGWALDAAPASVRPLLERRLGPS